jgi:hypothetical protein
MARVTDAEVKEIIATTLDTTPFINTATKLVTKYLSGEDCHDSETLELVELWLAAHFTALRERQLEKEKLSKAEDTYLGRAGMGLEFTQYGQTAKMLDCSGKLASMDSKKRAIVFEVVDLPADNYSSTADR